VLRRRINASLDAEKPLGLRIGLAKASCSRHLRHIGGRGLECGPFAKEDVLKTKLLLVSLAAAGFCASTAFAQMQPIPNPPEKPASSKHHAKKKSSHHAKPAASSAPAKPAAADNAAPPAQ
jgi:hypothetical protein